MDEMNYAIAIEVMGWEQGNFKCVDGKKFTLRDQRGDIYTKNDSCIPDWFNNDCLSVEVLSRFFNWEIAKYTDSSFKVSIRHKGKLAESFGEKLSQVISRCALLAVRM